MMNKRTLIGGALLALIATAGQAQVFTPGLNDTIDFVVEGTLKEGTDTILLIERPYPNDFKYKKFPVKGKRFRISIRQPLHKFMQIEDGKDGWMTFIVDNQPARIDIDFRTNAVVKGSPLNKRFNRYQLAMDSLNEEMDRHKDDANHAILDSLQQRGREIGWASVIENFDNVIPVYHLGLNNQFCMITPEQLAQCMKEEHAFAHHPDMEQAWKYYWAMEKRLPGQKFHDIELPDTTGTSRRLSEFVGQGHYVLLDFWASWCGPCMGSMPGMKALHAKYADRGLQIIGISFDSKREAWLSAIHRLELPWLQLSDLKGWKSIASDVYGVRAIPETVLIDPDGNIVSTGLRDKELEKKLEEIFKKE